MQSTAVVRPTHNKVERNTHNFDRRHEHTIREAYIVGERTGLGPILETGIYCLECHQYISVLDSECPGDRLARFRAA
jgi:hypothetical protein